METIKLKAELVRKQYCIIILLGKYIYIFYIFILYIYIYKILIQQVMEEINS